LALIFLVYFIRRGDLARRRELTTGCWDYCHAITENQLENGNVGDRTGGETETCFGVATAALVGGPDDVTEAEGAADGRCGVPTCGTLYCVMSFFAMFCIFTQRACLSVAIVAMVNHSAAVNDAAAAAEIWSNATNVTRGSV